MALELTPINEHFGAFASGINISKDIGEKAKIEIEEAMDEYAVLIWRNSALDDNQQLKLAENFGNVEVSHLSKVRGKGGPTNKSIVPISNIGDDDGFLDRDGRRLGSQIANQLWHSDSSFMQTVAKYSLLSAREVPEEGGDTQFADLRAAYDDLSEPLKEMTKALVAQHHALHSRMLLGLEYTASEIAASPPSNWPLVRIHPTSQRQILFVPIHIKGITGMSSPEALLLVSELIEHSTQQKFCFSHTWQKDDLVMWDNRCTLHRGRRYSLDQRRILRRITTMQN